MVDYETVSAFIKGREEVSIPELQREFSADYLTIVRIVRRLVSEGALMFVSGVKYAVRSKKKGSDAADEAPLGNAAKRRAYLEARRREILKSMREEDDDDDDDEDDEDEDDEDEDLSGDMPLQVYAIFHDLNDSASLVESDEKHYIVPHGLLFNGEQVRLRLSLQENGVYLTDDGLASRFFGGSAFSEEGVGAQIGAIAEHYGVSAVGGELQIKVSSPKDAVPCMMQLFAAMERIAALDDVDAAVCAEYREEDEKIRAIAREFVTAEPEIDRGALISRMRERYQSVKDGEDIDAVILCARGIKEFTRMSDETYLKSRSILLGEEEKRGPGEEEDESPAPLSEEAEEQKNISLAEEIGKTSTIITDTLARYRIDAAVDRATVGPSVVQYELSVSRNISVSAVARREAELAMYLRERNGVRVYGGAADGQVCIEVPRRFSAREWVDAEELLRGKDKRWEKEDALYFAVGKKIDGGCVYGDLTRLKHILIGGSCGSGKSSLLHTMIYSFITKYSPDDVRLILCDARQKEFMRYHGMPHLLTGQIVTSKEHMVHALRCAQGEMERRYRLFENKTAAGDTVRDINEYNASRREGEEKLPRIVIIVEEYSDFLDGAKRDIEERVQWLAQKARAAGLHLVLATQRPASEVITGTIKMNFPTRIALRMIQELDSRIVLDEGGAEKLLGSGDMLMRSEADFRCERIQAAHISLEASLAAVAADKKTYEAKFDEAARYMRRTERKAATAPEGAPSASCVMALATVIKAGEASISLVQRKCGVGYNHAGKIIEWMECMGYISPFDAKTKKREVLITREQFIKRYGPLD